MIQKKTKEKAQDVREENGVIREVIRKSALTASGEFEFRKLVRPQEGFLNCSMEEEKENLIMTYEVENLFPWSGIRREKGN